MTVIYIVGNGAGIFTPKSSATAQIDCWGSGSASTPGNVGGASGGWSRKNSFSLTAGTPVSFLLGAPGTTSAQNGADTWFSSSATVLAPGGGTGTVAVGDVTNAGSTGSNVATGGNPGGSGAAGPHGVGNIGGGGATSGDTAGGGGGGNGGGTAGSNSSTTTGGNGGNGFNGTGGVGTTGNGAAGGPGAGAAGDGGSGTLAAAGSDDYDNGGGGGGGARSTGAGGGTGGNGGTPGGGGGASNGAGAVTRGGYSLIRISYTGTDPDQMYILGAITSVTIPANYTANCIAECWAGGGGGGTGAAASSKGGGGAGAYSKKNILTVTAGSTLTVAVGAGGAAQVAGGDTTIASTTVVAKAGGTTTTTSAGAGGLASGGTGDVKSNGGNGGTGLGAAGDVGGGGGGAGGPDGAGAVGANGTATQTTGAGGRGDNSLGGLGGATAGATNTAGNPGGNSTLGGGGGSGSGGSSTAKLGGAGGFPGGGGGGGGGGATTNTGGAGGNGLIILTQIAPSVTLSWLSTTTALPRLPVQSTAYIVGSAPPLTPQPPLAIDWYEALRDPYLVQKLPTAAYPSETHPTLPPPLGIISWYAPLSTPPAHLAPRTLPIGVTSPAFFPGFVPIAVPVPAFGYFKLFNEPPPPLPSRAVYMPPATGPPPNYAFDRWFQEALSEPPAYLLRPSLNTAIQQNHVEPITAALPGAPLVSNIHPGLNAWTSHTFALGERCSAGGNAYQCIQAGLSTLAPVGTGSFIRMQPGSGWSSGFSSGWGNPADTAAFKFLSPIDFTSLQSWANSLMAAYSVSGLPAPVTAQVWNDSTLTQAINTPHLEYFGIPNNGVPTLITAAPGESFRDTTANPLNFNAANGVAFDAPATGAENGSFYFYINVANVTIDGLQFRDLNPTGNSASSGVNGNRLIITDANASNFTIQNSILDGFALLYIAPGINSILRNCLLINQQTAQNATATPLWPVIYDNGSVNNIAVNCTAIGFNPSGTCSMFTTLGGIGQAAIINTCAFGLNSPFFAQNTGASISADHCATDQSSFSGPTGLTVTDNGGNILNLPIAGQFLNPVTDFRLQAISGLIDRARADIIDVPTQQDIYRTTRPQGLGWDIGADEFVFSLVWLGPPAQPVVRSASLPIALRSQEPPFIAIQTRETTTVDRYHQPLSRQIPPPQGLAKHLQQALVEPITIQTAEVTTVTRWLASYPAIVLGKATHPSRMPALFETLTITFTQDVTRFRWEPEYPDIIWAQRVHASIVPFSTSQPTSPVFRETTGVDRWYSPLSTPQLWRVFFREQAPPTEPFVPIKVIPVPLTVLPTAGNVIITGYGPLITRSGA